MPTKTKPINKAASLRLAKQAARAIKLLERSNVRDCKHFLSFTLKESDIDKRNRLLVDFVKDGEVRFADKQRKFVIYGK